MKTLLVAFLLLACLPVQAQSPPPGTVLTICASFTWPDGRVEVYCECIVVKSPVYQERAVYSAKPDPLLNGMKVRRIVWVGQGSITYEGIQTVDGGIFPSSGGQ